jgi:anti-sigma regulatory factor (Ser/Thr protein kinase)
MPIVNLRPAVAIDFAPGDVLALLSDGIFEFAAPHGELFGEERVVRVLREHRAEPAAQLAARLLEAVRSFAQGAPQEDDITLVLLKRDPAAARRAFARRIEALDEIAAFTSSALEGAAIDDAQRHAVEFTIEELFTNMVKYAAAGGPRITIEIDRTAEGVEVTLIDTDVSPFDPTTAPDAPIGAPVAQRTPGGLGLHVLRRLVDSLDYRYDASRRESRTRFVVGLRAKGPAC